MTVIPRPASTVILVDDLARVYLTKRPSSMKFYGGHYVFPGGAVDKSDYEYDNQFFEITSRNKDFDIAYYIAAARELFEEVGILLTKNGLTVPKEKEHKYRQQLINGEITLLDMLKRENLCLNLDNLTYFAHRITSSERPIRFDTRFFIAKLPPNQLPIADKNEVEDVILLTPQELLSKYEKGELLLPRPTKMALKAILSLQTGENITMDDFYRMEEEKMNILITGGTKGIGQATALAFSSPGNQLFLNYYHDDNAATKTSELVADKGAMPFLLKYNLGNLQEVEEMANFIKRKVESIDLIVHCAVGIVKGDPLEIEPKNWRMAVEVSSLSLIDIIRNLRPLLKYGSSIVVISGRGANKVIPKYAAIGTTKAFTESIIRYLAVELAPYGIRANVLAPTTIDTEAFRMIFGEMAEERLATAELLNPSGRKITFQDITDVIRFLASPAAQMIQGEVIRIDGGINLK